ncbi:hypothetical protein CS8_057020 [Cupriavidus sp. 8B]
MQVHYDEGRANHIGPEPCADRREVVCEASVGECSGQTWSRDRCVIPAADAVQKAKRQHDGACKRERLDDPVWSTTLARKLIERLNPILRGWGHYYRRSHVRRLLNRLDRWPNQKPALGNPGTPLKPALHARVATRLATT